MKEKHSFLFSPDEESLYIALEIHIFSGKPKEFNILDNDLSSLHYEISYVSIAFNGIFFFLKKEKAVTASGGFQQVAHF